MVYIFNCYFFNLNFDFIYINYSLGGIGFRDLFCDRLE